MVNLLDLPDEVKILVFNHLRGIDKIQLMRTCRNLYRIGKDREVLRCLNFTKNYKLTKDDLSMILTNPQWTTELNLNGVYWIPSAELASILVKFPNLLVLNVVDTSLFFRDLCIVLNHFTKQVKKLAMSLKPDSLSDIFKASIEISITHLFVTYNSIATRALSTFITTFSSLEELWVIELDYPIDMNRHFADFLEFRWTDVIELSCFPIIIKKLVFVKQCHYATNKTELVNIFKKESGVWTTFYENEKQIFVLMENQDHLVNPNKTTATNVQKNTHLRFLKDHLNRSHILSVRDSQEIVLKNDYDINFTCLNLIDRKNVSNNVDHDPLELFKTILFRPNLKHLKKLRALSSTLVEFISIVHYREQEGTDNKKSNFALFIDHTTEMEDFEIIDVKMSNNSHIKWSLDSLKWIANWKFLKKLTLSSENFQDGKFLIDITKNCRILETLKLDNKSTEMDITENLCAALTFARNLKDFRFESFVTISIDNLLRSLWCCKDLERVFIQCKHTRDFHKTCIQDVLKKCENIVFLFIYISEFLEEYCKDIKQFIHNSCELKPNQIIRIRDRYYSLHTIIYEEIPSSFVHDIVCQSTEICYDYLKEF